MVALVKQYVAETGKGIRSFSAWRRFTQSMLASFVDIFVHKRNHDSVGLNKKMLVKVDPVGVELFCR